jgi:hypothetical protein
MKHASELAATKKRARQEAFDASKQRMSAMAKPQPSHRLSELERLPVELIQQIFLHSLELNMPRASMFLARSLSNESIYSLLILFAFFDDDGRHPVDKELFAPAQYRELGLAEKLHLQTSILNSRWCTLHRLRRNMPALSRLAILQAWHEEHDRERQLGGPEPKLWPTPLPALQAVASLPALGDAGSVERHFLARSSRSADDSRTETSEGSTYLPRLRTWTSFNNGDFGYTYKTVAGARGVLNVRYIPAWILRGSPWTAEKLDFLKFLRQGWRFLQKDFVLKISAVALFDGMASAIAECNTEALTVLLELHFAAFQDETSHTSRTTSGRVVRYALSFSHPIPLELFHLATRQRISTQLIGLLLREGIDSIRDDAVLTKWALTARRGGNNKRAEWLLKHMEGTEDYGLNGPPLFANGSIPWWPAAGGGPFPGISFTDELGYMKDGAVDFRPQRLDAQ